MRLGYDEIGEILKIIDSSSCEEFVLETENIKLVVRRRSANGSASPFAETVAHAEARTPLASPSLRPRAAPTLAAVVDGQEGLHVVSAPMVGTFYRSPSPGTPPYVEVGSRVKKGDPLCIIEVMKLFTTITAEHDGTIVEIGAENATLVEYGQMLFVLKPE